MKEHTIIAQASGPLLTTSQFAKEIAFHPESVRRAVRAGRLTAVRFGRTLRIPKTELERVLREGIPG